MKKVININFQGRVIPIEETAYELLQNYISSLRAYFANEEGRDEIINDIESRIAELFGENLKKGAACITDEEVNKVMDSMGRPADFAEADANSPAAGNSQQQSFFSSSAGRQQYQQYGQGEAAPKRLYRDEQDKIIAGVASGIAQYINIDPALARILFVLITLLGGSGILIYIVLWIVLPSRSLQNNIRKRLFRDPDDKVISGVCGGLGKYFDINPAIPRIIFAAPFLFGIVTSIGRNFFDDGPLFFGGFGGSTFILAYIILWIVLPEATTAAEKLEMRGKKVDLNTIRDTVVNDLQGVKGRAQKMGEELKASAEKIGTEMKHTLQERGAAFHQEVKRSGGGIAHVFGVLVKAFIYFILGCVAFGLFVALIALLGAGVGVMPFHAFFLQGNTQYLLALGSIILFVGVPIISLLVWFIRRLMKVRTHNRFLGYGFTALWFVGLFCVIALLASIRSSFSAHIGKEENISLVQPASGKLQVEIARADIRYESGWLEMDGVLSIDGDSMHLNTARVHVVKSKDSLYHLHLLRMSRGRNRAQAQQLAEKINFPIRQQGDTLYLPESFTVCKADKWRNQKVMVVIEVPVGKQIRLADEVNDYDYFSIDFGRKRRGVRIDINSDWLDGLYWKTDCDMKMTDSGLEWEDNPDNVSKSWNEDRPMRKRPADSRSRVRKDHVYRYKPTTGIPHAAGQRLALSPLASLVKMF
jgi:phage shock protein PspC (stress-responsive transcriptional regulator)